VALSENGGISVTNLGTTSVPGNPPIITVDNYGCVNGVVTFTGDVAGTWVFDAGSIPGTAFGMGPHEVIYTSTGRKTIVFNGTAFTSYIDIFAGGPAIPSITPSIDTVVLGCPTAFTTSITSTNYEWVFGAQTIPDTLNGPSFQSTGNIYYQELGLHSFELWLEDTCCGAVKDSGLVYVDTSLLDINLIASIDTICAGDTLTFTADLGYSNYEFYLNDSLVQSGTSNMYETTTQQNNDSITVIGFDGTCFTNRSTTTNSVIVPIPPVSISSSDPDTTICQGDLVTFTALPSFYQNYEFIVGTASVQSGPSNIYTTDSLNDLDSITVISYLGCPGPPVNKIYFTVNPLPVVTISSTDTTFCDGDTITVTASPPGLADYQIIVNNVTAGSGTQNIVSTNLFSNGDSIVVIPTSADGCVGPPSNDLVFIVNPIPSVTLSGATDTVCLYDTLTFTATPVGLDNYDFYDGTNIIQSGASNVLNTSALTGGNHSITVIATDLDCPSPVSNAVLATVLSGPTVFISASTDTICAGDTIVYSASPGSLVNYEFFVGGISMQSGASTTISSGALTVGDSVYVIGTELGCQGPLSNVLYPMVNPLPVTTLTSNDSDATICDGDTVILTASPTGLANYEFFLNGTSVQSGPDSTYTIMSLADGDSLEVIGISTAVCTGPPSNILSFTVNPIPSISLTVADDSICWGDSVVFTASPPGYDSYNFYNNGVPVQSGGAITYAPIADSTNLITVIASDLSCPSVFSNDTSVTVIYGPLASIISSDTDGTICDGDSVSITANPVGLSNYEFFVNLSAVQSSGSNIYSTSSLTDNDSVYVIGTYLGCPGPMSTSLQFQVNPIPTVGSINVEGTICYGQNNTFTAAPDTLGSYAFFVNGDTAQTGGSPSFLVNPISDGDTVTIIATDLDCPSLLSNMSLAYVNALPTAIFFTDTVCQATATTFIVQPGPGVNLAAYYWIEETGADTTAVFPPHYYTYSSPGTFTASLIFIDNQATPCSDTITNTVVVNPNPVSDFTMLPDSTTLMNPVISFTDVSNPPSPDTISQWSWNFGDGESNLIQNPIHEYSDSGYYTVSLMVTNEFGCIDERTDLVKVYPDYNIHFPNTFTPNGDTYNDVFLPVGIGTNSEFEMYIFNRWGDMIFESYDANTSWDGYGNKGKKAVQEGVYIYVVYFRDHLGKQHEYVGHVTLIR
jgi:gliding motility-associated-like protein